MEKSIKRAVVLLCTAFVCFWLVAGVIVLLGETDIMTVGLYAADESMAYILESACILATAACIPLSLKLFSVAMKRIVDKLTFPKALQSYILFSLLRLAFIFIPVYLGFAIYYLVLTKTGLLCAMIGLVASLFCVPDTARLRKELYISTDDE